MLISISFLLLSTGTSGTLSWHQGKWSEKPDALFADIQALNSVSALEYKRYETAFTAAAKAKHSSPVEKARFLLLATLSRTNWNGAIHPKNVLHPKVASYLGEFEKGLTSKSIATACYLSYVFSPAEVPIRFDVALQLIESWHPNQYLFQALLKHSQKDTNFRRMRGEHYDREASGAALLKIGKSLVKRMEQHSPGTWHSIAVERYLADTLCIGMGYRHKEMLQMEIEAFRRLISNGTTPPGTKAISEKLLAQRKLRLERIEKGLFKPS
ncbi:MAG: hypothetical protein JNJ45_05895 [Chthonomonas sp.]|nr:hypothetical protein [Chthonomonas sp.]